MIIKLNDWLGGSVFFKKVVLSFVRAFVGVFIAGVGGVFALPNWSASKAALVALSAAALTAGFRAVQALLTDLEPTK